MITEHYNREDRPNHKSHVLFGRKTLWAVLVYLCHVTFLVLVMFVYINIFSF